MAEKNMNAFIAKDKLTANVGRLAAVPIFYVRQLGS
jgi:hypothetical protein